MKHHFFTSTLLMAAITFAGCSRDEPSIRLTDSSAHSQVLWADHKGYVSVDITIGRKTSGTWRVRVATPEASWIYIPVNSGYIKTKNTNTTSFKFEPERNVSGKDRSAVIAVSYDGEEISLTVTQLATTESGKVYSYFEFENMEALSQTLYADQTECSILTFTTAYKWTSNVSGSWVYTSLDNGGAGQEYSVSIHALRNHTGRERSAAVSFFCNGDEKTVTIIQKETDAEGLLPEFSHAPAMVSVEGGTFMMGCSDDECDGFFFELPVHQVTLSSYHIGKYPVTQGLWTEAMGNNPSVFRKGDNYPVENVKYDDIQEFILRLNAMTGKNYRLPTEAEWEYAARGGKNGKGFKYSGNNYLDGVAWYRVNSDKSTHPVGTKQPNELGIYDMSGNVFEFCSDLVSYYSDSPKTNPTGNTEGFRRIFRGGCYNSHPGDCRVSYRGDLMENNPQGAFLGFRLVLPLEQ